MALPQTCLWVSAWEATTNSRLCLHVPLAGPQLQMPLGLWALILLLSPPNLEEQFLRPALVPFPSTLLAKKNESLDFTCA